MVVKERTVLRHLYLTEEHEMFRRSLRRFLEKEAKPFFEQWEQERLIPKAFWRKMGIKDFSVLWSRRNTGALASISGTRSW